MREGRRLAGIDGTRRSVCDSKHVKETGRRYGERVWKEDQGKCMKLLTEDDITSTKTWFLTSTVLKICIVITITNLSGKISNRSYSFEILYPVSSKVYVS